MGNTAEIDISASVDKYLESEKRFDLLSELCPTAIGIIKLCDGKIIKCNSIFLSLYNSNQSAFNSKNFFNSIVAPDIRNEIVIRINQNYSIKDCQVTLCLDENNYFIGSLTLEPVAYNGEKAAIISIINLSEKEKLDEENQRLLEDLEISKEMIEEEAAKMIKINIQLEESEEKLKEMNTAKDKLFSIIAHDLKNPFFVIRSYAEIINEEYDQLSDVEKHEIIKSISETSKYANRLLENLLHWARTQTGRIEFEPEPLNLRRVVNTSINLLNSQALKKNIRLTSLVEPTYVINADLNMLETVLRNLIANAIKFTPENGEIKISSKDCHDFIELSVTDTGIGISPEDIQKLFRMDVNNSQIGNSKEKGTGLGLILCKEFVELHGGTIWVESEEGKGSQFKFTLSKSLELNH